MSQNKLRTTKTPLRYHPNTRMYHERVLNWKKLPQKTCFLDDIMKLEKKKIGP